MLCAVDSCKPEKGFTLVEMMVAMVIALVLILGLFAAFQSQYGQFKYQNKRVDATQDLELGIRFIVDDLRLALQGAESITIANNASAPNETTDVNFKVWSEDTSLDWPDLATAQTNKFKAARHYQYDAANKVLNYDRNTIGGDAPVAILGDVTYFKVFADTPGVSPAGYADAPPGLPSRNVLNASGDTITVSGYTILIEMKVDAASKIGQKVDVKGNATTDKRIWRYAQIYPMAAL